MSLTIPDTHAHLLKRETKAYATLGLVLSDGTPHVSPIWFEYDGTHLILNTARGRVKDRLMHKHPAVALTVIDPNNWLCYLLFRGKIVEETEEGAFEVICDLSEKYDGHRNFPRRPGQVRVTYKILPERVYAGD